LQEKAMNRRRLLQGIAALPLAGAVTGCKHHDENPPTPRTAGTLRVILHGPFGVVLDRDNDFSVQAFVPNDPEHLHEVRFRSPSNVIGNEKTPGKYSSFHFEVDGKGLQLNRGIPRIDAGFHDFNFRHLREFEFRPKDYFVSIKLPKPDYITFFPPAAPIVFGGRATLMPLNHVLEYRMQAPELVKAKSPEVGEQSPLTCVELRKEYQELKPDPNTPPEYSQRSNIDEELKNCDPSDLCLLLGVGLNPASTLDERENHGIEFFNHVLLPALAPRVKKMLAKIGTCGQAEDNSLASPMLMPAVYRYPISRPRLLTVSSLMDCQVGGGMGLRP